MIRFAVVGTNWITKQFVDAAHETGKYKLTAIYSRSLEQAQAFAKDYPVEHLFTSLDELAQSPDVDAVYIASPNSLHFPQTRLFLSHKKHVICEKPLASNLQEVEAAIALAKENNVVLFEAFKTASLPNFLLLKETLAKVGKLRKAFINYCQYSSRYQRYLDGENPNTFNPAFSNGSIMQKINVADATLQLLASPEGRDNSLQLRQQAWVYHIALEKGEEINVQLHGPRAYLQSIHGSVHAVAQEQQKQALTCGDGAFIRDEANITLVADTPLRALLIDLPV